MDNFVNIVFWGSALVMSAIFLSYRKMKWAQKTHNTIKDLIIFDTISDTLGDDPKYKQRIAVKAKLVRITNGEILLRLSGAEKQLIGEMLDAASRSKRST